MFPAARRRLKRADGAWPPVSTASLRKPLLVALEAAGLEGHLTTHGLRRTFNDLMRQVSSGEVVRSIMGHVTERMTEHYSHVRSDEKADAVARILRLVHPSAKVGTQVGTSRRNGKRPVEGGASNRPISS